MKYLKTYKKLKESIEYDVNYINDDHIYKIWEILEYRDTVTGDIIKNIKKDEIPTDSNKEKWRYHIYKIKKINSDEIFKINDYITHLNNKNPNGFGNLDFMYIMGNQLRLNFRRLGLPLREEIYVLDENIRKSQIYNI